MSFNRSLFLTALAFFVSSQGVQFGQRGKKCQISDAAIFEASGLATSKTFANVAYTLNDRAGKNEIFAVDVNTCQTLAVYTVNSATNWDWEDLAYGPCLDDCQNGTVCR
ncbi:Ig domain-containing protein [Biomphalaria pfeifferi]|uniref:Ig domain-containing protein n=1 Tax=Biomphalaria pfeifferi TaxID=112525 RepID=A0AAD8B2A3_BIOPF|nr:Ig domain-containing protein [Biomphalaria pfeifferi]